MIQIEAMADSDIQGNNNFIKQYFYENSNTNGWHGKKNETSYAHYS